MINVNCSYRSATNEGIGFFKGKEGATPLGPTGPSGVNCFLNQVRLGGTQHWI